MLAPKAKRCSAVLHLFDIVTSQDCIWKECRCKQKGGSFNDVPLGVTRVVTYTTRKIIRFPSS